MVKWLRNLTCVRWFNKLCFIVRAYDRDHEFFMAQIREATNLIRDRTDISADVSMHARNPNQIILVGRYRNRDYVQVFTVHSDDLKSFVEQLRAMEKYGAVTKIDCAHDMAAVIKREMRHG